MKHVISLRLIWCITVMATFARADTNLSFERIGRDFGPWGVVDVIKDGQRLYVGHNSLAISDDGGATWTDLNPYAENGLSVNSVYANGDLLFVGSNYGLSVSRDAGLTWSNFVLAGTMEGSVLRPYVTNETFYTNVHAVKFNDGRLYVLFDQGLMTSVDGGLSWDSTGFGPSGGFLDAGIVKVPMVVSGNHIHVGSLGVGLYSSDDMGATWHRSEVGNSDLAGDSITSLELNGQKLYAGTNGGLSTSLDGGLTWSTRRDEFDNVLGPVRITSLHHTNGLLWVGADNTLYATADDGESWATIQSFSMDAGSSLSSINSYDNTLYVGVSDYPGSVYVAQLAAVPEPSTYGLVLGFIAMGASAVRRRRMSL